MNILDNPAFKDPQVQMYFSLLMVESIVALWVVNDARSRGKSALHAYWWGLGALISPIILLAWFFLRPKTNANTTSSTQTSPSPFASSETVGTSVPENGDKARSKICDRCGKFYLGKFDKCPHCNAAIEN